MVRSQISDYCLEVRETRTGGDSAGVPTLLGTVVHVQCWLDVSLVNSGPQLWVWVTPWSLWQLSVLLLRCWCFAGNLSRAGF